MMNGKRVLLTSILALLLSTSIALPSLASEKAGGGRVALTAEEQAFLAGKQLRLGVDSARPPFEFLDEKGVYSGISADFMQASLQRLGVPFVLVPGLNVGAAMKKMKEGEIDVVPKISPDPERAKEILFTRSHATFASVIVTRQNVRAIKGIDDLAGLKVGVLKGLIVEASVKRDFPNLPLISLPDVRTALVELSSGQIDVYIDNMAIVSYNIGKLGLNNLKIAAQTPYNYDMAFGVRKDWPLLASALDKALASLSKEEKIAITDRWLPVVYQQSGINWKVYLPIVFVLLIIIVTVVIWNRSLRRVIGERELIQAELKENTRLLEFRSTVKAKLAQISIELQQAASFEELARTFLSQIAPLTGAAYGVFYLMDEQKQLLQAVGGYGWMEAEAKSRQFQIGQGLVGQCAREKKPLSFNSTPGSHIRITWGGGQFDPRAILMQPILEQDKILAVVELGALQPFTPEHQALLDEIIPTVALNLSITRRNLTTQELLAKGQEQIAELGKARKATLNILEDLESSRKETVATMQKINAMSQAVYDALVMIDDQGKVQFWNQGAVKLFGYSAEEAMGIDFHTAVVPAGEQEKAQAGLRHFAATGQGVLFGGTVETHAVNRAGQTFPVEVNLSPFQVGEKWFAVGTVRNITARKQAEAALRTSQSQMRTLVDSFQSLIFMKDAEGRYLLINAFNEQNTGVPERDVLGKTDFDILPRELAEKIVAQDREVMDARKGVTFEMPGRPGTDRVFLANKVPLINEIGEVYGICGISTDITDRKLAEKELQEKMEELERFSRLTVNREEKMIQLKEEINTLLEQMGKEKRYKIVE
ncbi:MAG: transporter substrate-binding domain-containing protein [Deltaproteobacteria bacterium]|nr:transporter substrate-binding domain-containing protein [Deltaproteobacteria bacterium]